MVSVETLIASLSDYVWGNSLDDAVSPKICVESFPFLLKPCVSILLTKLIGVAIILGASLNKAPIFRNILNTRSGAGFSTSSVYADCIMYSNAAFYGILRGNPFTSWGENGIVALQALGVVALLWKFKKDPAIPVARRILAVLVYAAYVFAAFTLLRPDTYHLLHTANRFFLLYARGSQIGSTLQVKHTGNQSIVTITMNLGGSVIRTFTTLKEVGWDMALLSGYILSAFLNVALAAQYFYYRKNTLKFLETLVEKKEK